MIAPARAAQQNTRKSSTTLVGYTFVEFATSVVKRKKGTTDQRYLQIQTTKQMNQSNLMTTKPTILAVSEPGILDDETYRPCIGHKDNLENLRSAFEDDAVCLMEVTLKATEERVAALCAAVQQADGHVSFTPFAIMLNGNPYELLVPPSR